MRFDSAKGDCCEMIYDANGVELVHPVCGDTLTGLVMHLYVNENGDFESDESGNLKKIIIRHPAPLTIKNYQPGSWTLRRRLQEIGKQDQGQ